MATVLRHCSVCKKYTLQENHCDQPTLLPRPPKFSLTDKYGEYRRQARLAERKQLGFL